MAKITVITIIIFITSICSANDGPLPPKPKEAEVSDNAEQLIIQRQQRINEILDSSVVHSHIWYWGWTLEHLASTGIYTGLAIAQRDDNSVLPNRIICASQSLIGAVAILIFPPKTAFKPRPYFRKIANNGLDSSTNLAIGESLLFEIAKEQRKGRNWINHAGGILLGAIGGLLLSFAFDETDWKDGLINFAGSVVINELTIWSRPFKAARALPRYESEYDTIIEPIKENNR